MLLTIHFLFQTDYVIPDCPLPLHSCFCVQVVVPTRVGQVYVYDTVKPEQDEYDIPPRHQPLTQQDIYDVPPTRQQYNTQVRLGCACMSDMSDVLLTRCSVSALI